MLDLLLRALPGDGPVTPGDVLAALTHLINVEREIARQPVTETVVTVTIDAETQRKALGVYDAEEKVEEVAR